MADLLVQEGYADVGYEYVNVDDCWFVVTFFIYNKGCHEIRCTPNFFTDS